MVNTKGSGLLWAGFEGRDSSEVDLGFTPGGLVLFSRNLDADPWSGPERCHALISDLKRRWGSALPLPVAVDQEGGVVSRLRCWTGETPSLRTLWLGGGAAACERWGRLWGQGLRLLGFNVDFAPVADLHDGHAGTGLGDRMASDRPEEAALAAGAFLFGLEGAGVRGCLKHFPGLGGTLVDSHKALPELRDPERIARNLLPFRMLAHPDRLVMVAHLRLPGTGDRPASLHPGTVAANPWGIRGRWITDDLEMGGCSDWSWEERVRGCLEAGHQALVVCQTPAGIQACAEAAARMPEALAAPAARRFETLRRSLGPAAPGRFDRQAWDSWLETIRQEARRS
ncbi:MAG TPA: glycoside hydrolase family 3 N-terminal domain-containing protein [Holophaga sp.]|nr:glycoside hydrolase family 3 N-terminal domain-containing protein [Holophaga sp.]HPS67582.1 glycoside hydrolase family 3 N-terminal domain-containing protein [Holophaga sp.]